MLSPLRQNENYWIANTLNVTGPSGVDTSTLIALTFTQNSFYLQVIH